MINKSSTAGQNPNYTQITNKYETIAYGRAGTAGGHTTRSRDLGICGRSVSVDKGVSNKKEPAGKAEARLLRRRRSRIARPTQDELDALEVKDRLELLDKRRASRHQVFNTSGILLTIVFTALGLFYTRQTLVSGQEGQITDRYAKAVEQLGSDEREVRLGAIYALERIARDSRGDRPTINDVLAAFVREHDPKPIVKADKLPPEPDTDVQAALTVLGRTPHPGQTIDLHRINTPHANLPSAHLENWDLTGANLEGADLGMHQGLFWKRAHGVRSRDDVLPLQRAHLEHADLEHADLKGAILEGADLTGAHLEGADLRGAYLEGVKGMSVEEIRRVADTDARTRF